jgi:hypothetical protein
VALGLVDVSAGGVGVRVRADLEAGDEVVVDLSRIGTASLIRRTAHVRWCMAAGDGTFQTGLQFHRPLGTSELAALIR